MSTPARIQGEVVYREGDGPNIAIPQGPVELEATDLDVTISWEEGETHGSAAIPLADFHRHVAKRLIVIGPAQAAR